MAVGFRTHGVVLAVTSVLGFSPAAHAQPLSGLDTTAILAACQTPAVETGCQDLVLQALAMLDDANLTDEEHAAVIAQIAGAVLEAAQSSSGSTSLLSTVLITVSEASRDADQADAIVNVATLIEGGGASEIENDVFAASPA
ncbi:hypothetical protein [Salibaculum griseiflavum]|nr:hypothetical protein [Salibaculum griseiflavum]